MERVQRRERLAGWTFLLIAVGGLFYVKWLPYWHRAALASSSHAIGSSILMGDAASPPAPSWQAALTYASAYGRAVWQAAVLGLLLGSAVQALVPGQRIARWLGRASGGSVARGTMLGLPGMMCSCCAAPVVVGLRRADAAAGAATAFWLANSLLNPATLVFIGFVLGWRWAALRLALGLATVLGLGVAVNRTAPGSGAVDRGPAVPELPAGGADPFTRWFLILARMATRLLPEYALLVLLLGAARAWLFPHMGPAIGDGLGWIAVFAVAGAVFVIPTAGEVPIIQAMLALGVGAGPAGALLMALPPISAPSLAMVWSALGPRPLALVAGGVVAAGIVAGLLAAALRF